jgi:hypothetical protein
VSEKIEHREARVIPRRLMSREEAENAPPEVKQEDAMVAWACSSYRSTMWIMAAGILAKTKSLDTAASVLWWAGFRVPAGYFTDEEEDAHSFTAEDEEALQLWVERERENIERTIQSKGFYLFATGRLLEELEEE